MRTGGVIILNLVKQFLSSAALLFLAPLCAQTTELEVHPGAGWVDTKVDLRIGDTVRISATGQLRYANASRPNGPDGLPRAFKDIIHVMQVNDSGRGALVARIGSDEADRPFLVGEKLEKSTPIAGRLFLAVNQTSKDQAIGSFHVVIERSAAPIASRTDLRVPDFPQGLVDSIPRRVSSAKGLPGDLTNFILIGSLKQMQAVLKAAGWVAVDRTKKEMLVESVKDSVEKEAYVTMPMSELRLWDRPQDFGYAQGDPVRVVRSRHHFRLWKAPFELEDRTVWVGAGTHDIGLTRNPHNDLLTHKIDPNIDAERDYIRENLLQTGLVIKTAYLTPANPVLKAKTATDEEFTSDGRTLILYLAPEEPAK